MEKDNQISKLIDHKFFGVIILKCSQDVPPILKNDFNQLLFIYNSANIDLVKVKLMVMRGVISIQPSLRSLTWKVLLGYLSHNSFKWETEIDNKRIEYEELKKSYYSQFEKAKLSNSNGKSEKNDHPLNTTTDSKWNGYFKDIDLIKLIDNDLNRTKNDVVFFRDKSLGNPSEKNIDILRNILFIFAKQHPDISYVQGLNEILATIYYCFAKDENRYFLLFVESDAYFCFESLIVQMKDIFIKEKDNKNTGINSRLNRIRILLKQLNKQIYNNLNKLQIDIAFFVFRWYTSFFTQEYEMISLLHLWDFFIAQEDKFEYLNMLSLAIILIKKNELIKDDYSAVMTSLQSIDSIKVDDLVYNAGQISKKINSLY